MVEILNTDFEFKDERGMLVQIVHEGYKQINYIESKAGGVRGNHYHKLNRELFYVIKGKFKLMVERKDEKNEYVFSAGDVFVVNKDVIHTFDYIEDTQMISMYDVGVEFEDGTKDIYSE